MLPSAQAAQLMIEKVADGLVVVSETGDVLYVNPSAERLLGNPSQQVVGKPFEFSLSGRGAVEVEFRTAAGEARVVEVREADIVWDTHPAVLVTLHDNTEIHRIEQLKAEINERKRIDRLKDEFISTVSHELRTPLTIIKGAVDNMRDGIAGPLDDKQKKVVRIASNNVDRLAKIINNLLDLSRLESGRARINRQRVAIVPLIQDTVTLFQTLAKEKNLELSADLPAHAPDVDVDSDLLVQVLQNFLQNAFRFARHKVVVSVATDHLSDNMGASSPALRMSVSDDGEGVRAEDLPQLFDKFVQINRPSGGGGYKGTGLGLAICREIVGLHGGKIWAESAYGKGAEFHVSWPVAGEAAASSAEIS